MFCELPLHLWNPKEEDLDLLTEWMIAYPFEHLLNRIARTILSRLNWSFDPNTNELFIEVEKHQKLALGLYLALDSHKVIKNQKDLINSNPRRFGDDSLLSYAKSIHSKDFTKWVWNIIIILKLNSLEWTDKFWDFLYEQNASNNSNDDKMLHLNFDTNLIPICRGLEEQNSFAIYLALIMTDFGEK